ncbi:Ribonuclease HI [Planctomycetes bacterium Poly30]|uniref:ribonuclease H n=1 Tax=Saltatorellus ferox TaxID=2528018 RepID=A0A518F0S3_9BACT|nr:Ribonuclease HI [Planctomycetes bacterium Poly30]
MPDFQCQTCSASFSVSQSALDKYPGWKPRFCREHSPKKVASGGSARSSSRRGGARRGGSFGGGAPRAVEENLTLAQVMERYTQGPADGVFTDGSSVPNPGPGGWGAVWVRAGEVVEHRHGKSPKTTNNRMELTALIEAFRLLPEDATETIFTDSRLCVDTITKWAPNWKARGWKKKTGEIKNLELVQELLALYEAHPDCKLEWIAAHSGNRWNEYADSLSTAWMRDTL